MIPSKTYVIQNDYMGFTQSMCLGIIYKSFGIYCSYNIYLLLINT